MSIVHTVKVIWLASCCCCGYCNRKIDAAAQLEHKLLLKIWIA